MMLNAQCLVLIAYCSLLTCKESRDEFEMDFTCNDIKPNAFGIVKGFEPTKMTKLKKGTQFNRRWHRGSRMNELVNEMRENEIACTILFDLNVVSVRYCLHEISRRLPNVKKCLWRYLVTSMLTGMESCLALFKL